MLGGRVPPKRSFAELLQGCLALVSPQCRHRTPQDSGGIRGRRCRPGRSRGRVKVRFGIQTWEGELCTADTHHKHIFLLCRDWVASPGGMMILENYKVLVDSMTTLDRGSVSNMEPCTDPTFTSPHPLLPTVCRVCCECPRSHNAHGSDEEMVDCRRCPAPARPRRDPKAHLKSSPPF